MADSQVVLRNKIRAALAAISGADFADEAQALLGVLGYSSERTLPDQSGDPGEFLAQDLYQIKRRDTKSEQEFLENASSVRVVFQVTDSEIAEATPQGTLFQFDEFEKSNAQSFLFMAVELKGETYPRGRYGRFTREINKRLAMPAVVLFRTADGLLTLAFVQRRGSKTERGRDVLGRVSLIREIIPNDPHRAHLDILAELSLEERLQWMGSRGKQRDFDGLLDAWLDALDTEELNRRFYRELKGWFDWAVVEATFPTGVPKEQPPQRHVIRLITRLLFVWFIKEKGLVSDDLFVEAQVAQMLKDYDRNAGDSYYRAVLQNLFFATLNTPIEERGFRDPGSRRGYNRQYRLTSRYRYKEEIADADALVALFARTPFINGGLFDCLDSLEHKGANAYRIDYFSDNVIDPGRAGYEYGALSIPNRLFFCEDDNKRGLITLFDRYKFTVEENTPAETEVALDPELLGKVFENLLASVNAETGENVRKHSGSYYTPREVVDYMIDEALVAALREKAMPPDTDVSWWDDLLHYLLDYDDADELFNENQKRRVVQAIAELRVLDPAVGSGAFPMGVLHKLTLALRRLDPDNKLWADTQRDIAARRADAAFWIPVQQERGAALQQINDTFERYKESDFGRKLYLIQRCIFGVDNDPNATEIAKLRFFISLAIEQQTNADPDSNFGIHPLPNLETRFVTADSLLGLEHPAQPQLSEHMEPILRIESQLAAIREERFHARTRREKERMRDDDQRLRDTLAKRLQEAAFPPDDARKIAAWDPADQSVMADTRDATAWFDPEFMFGVRDGFNIVISNPPYAQLQKDGGRLGKLYKDAGYETFARTGDIYQLFYEKGFELLAPDGFLSYITSNSWLKAEYGKSTRRHMSERLAVLRLLEMGKDVFENVIVDASILIGRAGKTGETGKAVDMDRLADKSFPPDEKLWAEFRPRRDKPWSILSLTERSAMDKMQANGTPLGEWDVKINMGIKTGFNKAFMIDNTTREALIAQDPGSAVIIKPVLRGRDIQRYRAKWADLWLIDTHNGYDGIPAVDIGDYPAVQAHLDTFYPQLEKRQDKGRTPYNLRNCAYYEEFFKEKLLWIDLTENGRFAYVDDQIFSVNTVYMISGVSIKYLCAMLNSKLLTWYMKNAALTSGMGTTRWFAVSVGAIPIPRISTARQRPFINLVDSILEAKADNSDSDTSKQEKEIDRLVYDLYGLTDAEVAELGAWPNRTDKEKRL